MRHHIHIAKGHGLHFTHGGKHTLRHQHRVHHIHNHTHKHHIVGGAAHKKEGGKTHSHRKLAPLKFKF
jgi:hypothetical protein